MQLVLLLAAYVYTLFQLYLCSSFSRQVHWRTLISFVWAGAIGVTAVTICIHLLTTRLIPPRINSYTVNPLIEEALTILPLLLLARVKRISQHLRAVDWLLLGGALGLGFGLMETGLRVVGSAQQWNLHGLEWSRLVSILFTWLPEKLHYPVPCYAGHGIAAALMGLGLGLWIQRGRRWWFLFAVSFAWAVFDHALSNYIGRDYFHRDQFALRFWWLTGQGRFMPWALAFALIGVALKSFLHDPARCRDQLRTFFVNLVSAVSSFFQRLPTKFRLPSSNRQRFLFTLRAYFWFSCILIFFCNGFIPRKFYHWYFTTPLWWITVSIGIGFSLWNVFHLFSTWRHKRIPEDVNSSLLFWGNVMRSTGTIGYLALAGVMLFLDTSDFPLWKLFRSSFLYSAFRPFFHLFQHHLPSVLAVIGGMGGVIAHAEGRRGARPSWLPNGIDVKTGEEGADIIDLRPEIQRIIPDVIDVWQQHGAPRPVITSGNDGDHHPEGGRPSLHYSNLAIDLRGNNVSLEQLNALADTLRPRLGPDYFVKPEPFKNPEWNHIHIEYDPKQGSLSR